MKKQYIDLCSAVSCVFNSYQFNAEYNTVAQAEYHILYGIAVMKIKKC
jgi:hypothetical protein